MQEVYRGNPRLGSAASLNKQLDETLQKIENVQREIKKYEVLIFSGSLPCWSDIWCKNVAVADVVLEPCVCCDIFLICTCLIVFSD